MERIRKNQSSEPDAPDDYVKPTGGPLKPIHKLYCTEYIKDLNAYQAARRAGYSHETARNAARDIHCCPGVLDHIMELQREMLERTQIDADWIVKTLHSSVLKHVRKAADNPLSMSGMTQLERLGKHFGLFNDKTELVIPGSESLKSVNISFVKSDADGRKESRVH